MDNGKKTRMNNKSKSSRQIKSKSKSKVMLKDGGSEKEQGVVPYREGGR